MNFNNWAGKSAERNKMKKFSEKEIQKAEKENNDVAIFNMRSFNVSQDIEAERKK